MKNKHRVCSFKISGMLDNIFRKWIHNPNKLFREYVKKGTVVLDVGCGPGLFSAGMAKMVGSSGKVIAVDLQQGMLDKLKNKIKGTEIEKRIKLHKCEENKIGVSEKVDFALAFWMIHEVPDIERFFKEIKFVLKSNGIFYIIEPSFHVSKEEFDETIQKVTSAGFKQIKIPKIFLSRAMVFIK